MDKELEIAHLENFKLAFNGFPKGKIITSEGPDFLIRTLKRRIGIEHTQMLQPGPTHGGSLQAQEKHRQKVLNLAQEIYSENDGIAISASVIFFPNFELSSKEIPAVAEDLAQALLNENFNLEQAQYIHLAPPDCLLPPPISGVNLLFRPGVLMSNFSQLDMDSTLEISSDDIFSRIKDKERKIGDYKEKCDDIWLLIVADEMTPSSSINLSQEAAQYTYPTAFDRVFFLWNFQPKCVELSVTKKP